MHLIVDMSGLKPGCAGKLWLGGEMASTNLALLERNQVTVLMPASRKPALAEPMGLKVLPYIDGTGLACGDVSCEKFLERVEEVSQLLFEGHGVLVCCANGAHRSATELTVIVMRLTGWGAQQAAGYVTSLRNIVDLHSTAPPSSHRLHPTKPMDFLEKNEDRITMVNFGLAGNAVMAPVMFRKMALEIGFVTNVQIQCKSKSRARKPGDLTSSFEFVEHEDPGHSTVSSHDLDSSMDTDKSQESLKRARGSDTVGKDFALLPDELGTRAERLAKLKTLTGDLQQLEVKLLAAFKTDAEKSAESAAKAAKVVVESQDSATGHGSAPGGSQDVAQPAVKEEEVQEQAAVVEKLLTVKEEQKQEQPGFLAEKFELRFRLAIGLVIGLATGLVQKFLLFCSFSLPSLFGVFYCQGFVPDFGGDDDDEPPAKVETHADKDAKALEEKAANVSEETLNRMMSLLEQQRLQT